MVKDAQLAKGYEQAAINRFRDATSAQRDWNKAHAKVITRERGVIPGCRAPDPDSHMAVDGNGRPWLHLSKMPSTIDAWLASLREGIRQQRKQRNACEICGEMECSHGKKRTRAHT